MKTPPAPGDPERMLMPAPVRVVGVVPCHNEEAAIAKVVTDLRATVPGIEVHVYDNCSTDGTAEVARRAAARPARPPGRGRRAGPGRPGRRGGPVRPRSAPARPGCCRRTSGGPGAAGSCAPGGGRAGRASCPGAARPRCTSPRRGRDGWARAPRWSAAACRRSPRCAADRARRTGTAAPAGRSGVVSRSSSKGHPEGGQQPSRSGPGRLRQLHRSWREHRSAHPVAGARMVAAASTSQVSRPLWIDAGPIPAAAPPRCQVRAPRRRRCADCDDRGVTGRNTDARRRTGDDAPAARPMRSAGPGPSRSGLGSCRAGAGGLVFDNQQVDQGIS